MSANYCGFTLQCWQNKGTCLEEMYIEDGYHNDKKITIRVVGDDLVEIKCKTCGSSIVVRGDDSV